MHPGGPFAFFAPPPLLSTGPFYWSFLKVFSVHSHTGPRASPFRPGIRPSPAPCASVLRNGLFLPVPCPFTPLTKTPLSSQLSWLPRVLSGHPDTSALKNRTLSRDMPALCPCAHAWLRLICTRPAPDLCLHWSDLCLFWPVPDLCLIWQAPAWSVPDLGQTCACAAVRAAVRAAFRPHAGHTLAPCSWPCVPEHILASRLLLPCPAPVRHKCSWRLS